MSETRIRNHDWIWPLLITLVFLFAVHAAYALSVRGGYVPACVPYWEGCTSISRAARHGSGNLLFRALVIPCAALHAWVWWKAARVDGIPDDGMARLVRMFGVTSAIALAVYAAFLGTQGEIYGFLRRYGVTVYFGFGFLAQLLWMRRAARAQAVSASVLRLMRVLCAGMLCLGIGNVVAGAIVDEPALRDRIENALEWQLGLLLVSWFALLSRAWKRAGQGPHLR